MSLLRAHGTRIVAVVAVGAVVGLAGAVPPLSARLIVKQGDAVGPSTVSSLNTPFTDGNGAVGFVAALADSQRIVWHDSGPVFYSSDALPDVLTGGEGTMGVSNVGGFIYSPSFNGEDAVYTNYGKLLAGGDPIPGLPGLYSTFNSRATMIPNGTAYWVGGSTPTQGSSTSTNRHFFRANPSDPSSISRILGGGDVIEGKTISTSATNFDYWISDSGQHHVHVIDTTYSPSTQATFVYLDGHFVVQEGTPTGQGENWYSFDSPGVNDAGTYVFSADTNNANTAIDYVIAVNGLIQVREGDTLDGVLLAAGATPRALSINNLDQVAFTWGWGSGASAREYLFLGDAANLSASAKLLGLNDEIDVTNDGVADYLITDLEASPSIGPGLSLAEDGLVYVEVSLLPIGGGTEVEAIIAIPEPTTLGLIALAGLLRRRR